MSKGNLTEFVQIFFSKNFSFSISDEKKKVLYLIIFAFINKNNVYTLNVYILLMIDELFNQAQKILYVKGRSLFFPMPCFFLFIANVAYFFLVCILSVTSTCNEKSKATITEKTNDVNRLFRQKLLSINCLVFTTKQHRTIRLYIQSKNQVFFSSVDLIK